MTGDERSIEFEVAGTRLCLQGEALPDAAFLDEHYPGFWREGGEGLVLDCRWEGEGLLIELPPSGEPPVVEVEQPGDGRLVTRSHWHEAELDLGGGRGVARFRSRVPHEYRVSLENLLRVAFANLLLRDGACLVHAAALVEPDGRADVFFGLSGSGKSRVVELCGDRPALSDDLVALRLEGGALTAERVPFHGEFPSSSRAEGRLPVRHLLRVERGEDHALFPLPAPLAAARLRACLPFLRADDPRPLELALRIVKAQPVRALLFADDAGFRELLAEA